MILFAGNEDIDFEFVTNGVTFPTNVANTYRSSFLRNTIQLPWGQYYPVNSTYQQGVTGAFTQAVSEFWITFKYRGTSYYPPNAEFLCFYDGYAKRLIFGPETVYRMIVPTENYPLAYGSDSAGVASLYYALAYDTPGNFGQHYIPFANQLTRYDIYINYSGTGGFKVYENYRLTAQWNGDLTVANVAIPTHPYPTSTTLNRFSFHGPRDGDNYLSEIIISTEDSRKLSLGTMVIDGTATNVGWTGSYTGINELNLSNTGYIQANTGSEATFSTINPSTALASGFPVAVKVVGTFETDTEGEQIQLSANAASTAGYSGTFTLTPNAMQYRWSLGSSNYQYIANYAYFVTANTNWNGSNNPTQTGVNFGSEYWHTNPFTGNAWTSSELINLTIGVKN